MSEKLLNDKINESKEVKIKDFSYIEDTVECDWCHVQVEKKNTKYWVTGARLCKKCHKEAEDKHNKFLEEFKKETIGKFFTILTLIR